MRPRLLCALVPLLLGACVYVPVTTQRYDPGCHITTQHMQMEPVQIAAIQHCRNEGCGALLVAAGATVVASAVVTGSVVIVGNMVYWFEKRGSCRRGGSDDATEPSE